jgi:hypothetical protein
VLVRFVYLVVVHVFAALRLLSMTDREKDVEILALRHQLTILQRQLGGRRPRLRSSRPSPLPGSASTFSLLSITLAGGSVFPIPPRTPHMPG